METNKPDLDTETPPLVTPEASSPVNYDLNLKSSSKNKSIVLVLVLLVLGLLVILFYLYYQNTQLKQQVELIELDKPTVATCEYNGQVYEAGEGFTTSDGCNSCSCSETGEVACTAMACEPKTENNEPETTTLDDMVDWKRYVGTNPSVSIMYPPNYKLSGTLASSLETWEAGKGIVITDNSNPAQPTILIEAVYDGYGPFFTTGELSIIFENGRLIPSITSRISDKDYQVLINDNVFDIGTSQYLSDIEHYKGIPIWVRISHREKGNRELENELLKILSTFEFTD